MKNKIKKVAKASGNFVSKHRVGIAVAATSACWIAFNRSNVKTWNEFLETKGLTDEYYLGTASGQ